MCIELPCGTFSYIGVDDGTRRIQYTAKGSIQGYVTGEEALRVVRHYCDKLSVKLDVPVDVKYHSNRLGDVPGYIWEEIERYYTGYVLSQEA